MKNELRIKKYGLRRKVKTPYFLLHTPYSKKPGNAWVGIIILLVFLTTLGLALVSDAMVTLIQSKRAGQVLIAQSLCDAGIEKTAFKLNDTSGSYAGESNLDMETGVIDIEIINIGTDSKDVVVSAYVPSKDNPTVQRRVRARMSAVNNESGLAFNYGVQAGDGGLILSNNAVLNGNVYSAGSISCGNTARVNGDAFISKNSLGVYGNINNCRVGGNAEAYSVTGSQVDGWVKYVGARTGTTASGGFTQINTTQLDSDIPYISMNITEPTIQSWESWATDGGTFTGDYNLGIGQSASLGPKKIDGDLTLAGGSTLTLTGVVWVKGNIFLNTGSTLRLSPAYGPNSGLLIADDTDDRVNSGYVRVYNNVAVQGSGAAGSYILILSTSEKTSTSNPAIFAGNNSNAVVYYSSKGMINVNNNARLRAISGGGINIENGAIVDYDSGLASANFSGGPGGSWTVSEWQILY